MSPIRDHFLVSRLPLPTLCPPLATPCLHPRLLDDQSHPLVRVVAEKGGQLALPEVWIVSALDLVLVPVPLVELVNLKTRKNNNEI